MIGYYKSHEQVSTIRVLFQQWLVYFKISLWHQFQHSVWNKFGWKYLFIISSINKLSVGTATKLVILPPPHSINRAIRWYSVAWSSLVEGDEQLDRPNSQTCMECGSGGGSVGRAVASNSRGPWFKSSHWQKLYWTFTVNCIWKDKNKEKEAGNGPFLEHVWNIAMHVQYKKFDCQHHNRLPLGPKTAFISFD